MWAYSWLQCCQSIIDVLKLIVVSVCKREFYRIIWSCALLKHGSVTLFTKIKLSCFAEKMKSFVHRPFWDYIFAENGLNHALNLRTRLSLKNKLWGPAEFYTGVEKSLQHNLHYSFWEEWKLDFLKIVRFSKITGNAIHIDKEYFLCFKYGIQK